MSEVKSRVFLAIWPAALAASPATSPASRGIGPATVPAALPAPTAASLATWPALWETSPAVLAAPLRILSSALQAGGASVIAAARAIPSNDTGTTATKGVRIMTCSPLPGRTCADLETAPRDCKDPPRDKNRAAAEKFHRAHA